MFPNSTCTLRRALVLVALALTTAAYAESVPKAVRGLPLDEIKELVGGKPNWAYVNYTAGRGVGAASVLCPSPVQVGTIVPEAVVTVTAGPGGIAPGGQISVWLPVGASPPQTENPEGNGYIAAETGGKALDLLVQPVWFFRANRMFSNEKHIMFATVTLADGLPEGGTVTYTWRQFYVGSFTRRWAEDPFPFRVFIDHDADGWEEEIAESPFVPRIPAEANRLALRAQSTAVVGEKVRLTLMALDRFDNPARGYRGMVQFSGASADSLPAPYSFTQLDAGAHTFQATFGAPGYYWVTVSDEAGDITAESNPIEVLAEAPAYRLYWGDLHVHTEMSSDAVNAAWTVSTYDGSYNIGRYRYGLDFMANTDHHGFTQGNYAYEDWRRMMRITNDANAPGKFATLVAVEVSHGRGDQNVYFLGDHMPFLNTGPRHPLDLWDFLKDYECFTVPHHFAQSMRPWKWENFDPDLMKVVEVFSNHGRGEFFGNEPHYSHHPKPTLEGNTWQDQLAKGRKLGVIASTDDHWSRPGYCGLAAVWAKALTREALYWSIKDRHCYATTNARAILRFTVNGEEMGQVVKTRKAPKLALRGATPAEILEIHVVKDNEVVFEGPAGGRSFDCTWTDDAFEGEAYYYVRVKMAGRPNAEDFLRDKPEYVWSSPIWVCR